MGAIGKRETSPSRLAAVNTRTVMKTLPSGYP